VIGADDKLSTVIETDAAGKGVAVLAPATYALSATKEGLLIGPVSTIEVQTGVTKQATLRLAQGRTLSVQVADPFGAAIPAKVTVRCVTTPCPFSEVTWKRHILLEAIAGGAAAVGFVPMTGKLDLTVPPGEYEVVVSRGPEYSVWPETWPTSGHRVDLTTANGQVSAVVGRILDTPGWMSADLHVHAINSTDSLVPNEKRVANFLAEGVDVLVSTDHEFLTDFQPIIEALSGQSVMASIIGEEITSFSHGHFNTFPVKRDDSKGGNGGAFDHAGGEGPTLRLTELFPQVKEAFGGNVVQINHPRGSGGTFTTLKIDTATLASHGDPADFRMAPAPDATATNTRLFGDGFDGVETANGPALELDVVNDWMTFLSRGTVRTATGVSDSHKLLTSSGGYSRTWLRVGVDTSTAITPALFSEAVKKSRAVIGNGPFLKVTAQKVNAAGVAEGPIVEVGDTLKISAAANEGIEITVDVTTQEWVQFDRIELYSHAPGREAVNGESNTSWPEGRILAKKTLDPLALTVEAVPGNNGLPLRRVHVVEKFIQKPAKDTWFTVMVRSGATRTMFPLVDAKPYAMSNAILVDADGSGAYDDFPLKPGQPLTRAPEVPPLGPRRVPTAAEFEQALRRILHEDE
jgi:hypothetical protein